MQGKQRVTDIISEADIEKWHRDTPIIISAGTGVGKSYFVKNTLYDFARRSQKKILMFSHRKLFLEQFRMEIVSDHKDDVIDIMTYQKLEHNELKGIAIDLEKYDYIVCDEFHYFLSDAIFNYTTDISFERILEAQNAVKVFMSATGEDVERYIKSLNPIPPLNYSVPYDWSFIETLNFYHNDQILEVYARDIIKKGRKAIFFIQNATKAYEFYLKFREDAIFNCSSQNKSHFKYVDKSAINRMLEEQKFDKSILITTACMDSGVNIIDTEVKDIFVDIKDVGSLIQCIGRKRIQSPCDTFNLYIKGINNQQLGGMETVINKQLEKAEVILTSSIQEYIDKYPRQSDSSKITYDDKCNDDIYKCTKKVNKLMYQKKKLDIEEIQTMKSLGKYGYCKYMARKLGKYNPKTGSYYYAIISLNYQLKHYLSKHVGDVMLQKKDRIELIDMMNVRRDGHMKRSREILNMALKEEGFPYKIEEFKTSKVVDGKKKNFKAAWRIAKHDWSVK